ncbi:MAG: CDC48 family AAA ATPase [Nanoarchaeota archaeon]|nr:CDC48 family AAA ATPase [Nanoarchaeota archaeon]
MVKEDKGVRLKVVEALQDDVYKGVARIDPQLMRDMGLIRGDIISIKGQRETLAIVDRAYPEDVGENIIRVDGLIRNNVRVGVDEQVLVQKAKVKPAVKVSIAPAQQGITVQADPEMLRNGLLGRPIIKGDIISLGGVQRRKDLMSEGFPDIFGDLQDLFGSQMGMNGFQQIRFVVVSTSPNQPVFIDENTEIVLNPKSVSVSEEHVADIAYEDVGGMEEEIKKVREMVELPLKHPELFERLGIDPPRGVLLHGPPGTGKTLLAKAVATETDSTFFSIAGPEIMSKYYGESEKHIREIFEKAEKNAPSVIFIDEIDSIAPNRDEVSGEAERRIVSQLLTTMDGLKGRGNVVVIAATNRPNSIDPALRRPGRFDREIAINPPSRDGRREILDVHTRGMPLEADVDLDKIAEVTHGFTGADLEVLTKEAAMKALKKYIPDLVKFEEKVPTNVLETIKIKMAHFDEALHNVEPSAMREVLIRKPNVKWSDIGGLEIAKRDLRETVEMPLKEPEVFKEVGIKAPKGVLLTGPPGTGKTLLAKAVATESEANFISVKGPELISKWVGESEKAVREIFKKAKQVAPTVIFFDEFDSIATMRGGSSGGGSNVNDKVVNQLLTELDGVEELTGVSIIAATNRADLIDEALKRPGRLDSIIEVSLPDEKTRFEIFKIHTKNMPLDSSVDLKKLAKITDKFSGAMIGGVCQKAGLEAIRNRVSYGNKKAIVNEKMFEKAIEEIRK